MAFEEELSLAVEASKVAGLILIETRNTGKMTVHKKGEFDFVTEADLAVHNCLRERILKRFPDHQIISEEGQSFDIPDGDDYWLVDPIDGTVNFIHGHAHVSISMAYFSDGVPVVGVVYAPFTNEIFWGIKGQGAFCNGTRLQIENEQKDTNVLIGIGFPHDRTNVAPILNRLLPLLRRFGDVRRLASPALDICWVADGRLNAFLDRIQIWDIAAAELIAREAGAKILNLEKAADEMEVDDGDDYLIGHPDLVTRISESLCLGRQK